MKIYRINLNYYQSEKLKFWCQEVAAENFEEAFAKAQVFKKQFNRCVIVGIYITKE